MSGTDGQNRRNINIKVALFDSHFFWTLCECHMFEFDLCECEHKRQHQIYFTSGATTIHGACEYQTHTGEKSNKCNQYGATTIREYQGEYQTSQAASRAPTIKRSLPILAFCINQHSFLHPGGTIVEIISYTNMTKVYESVTLKGFKKSQAQNLPPQKDDLKAPKKA